MNKTNLLPFDLEVALKQPKRVVFRNGKKPKQWHYFDKRETPYKLCLLDEHDLISANAISGEYINDSVKEHEYDLFLLPEFTPEEGKWYWTQLHKGFNYHPTWFADGSFWVQGVMHSVSDFFHIHPEPINPPE